MVYSEAHVPLGGGKRRAEIGRWGQLGLTGSSVHTRATPTHTLPGGATLARHDAVLGGWVLPGTYGVGEVAGPIMALMSVGDYPHFMDMAQSCSVWPRSKFGDELRCDWVSCSTRAAEEGAR